MTLLADGIVEAFGMPLALMAVAALALIVVRRRDPVLAMAVACTGPAVVTFTAYLAGHPTKARYALLLAPAFALALAAMTRGRPIAQLGVAGARRAPARRGAPALPVLREATRDRAAVAERRPFVDTFRSRYHGGRLLASMGSTAPVLFETGLPLREVVHEGNGHYWANAVVDPAALRLLGADRRRRRAGPGPLVPAGVPGGVRPRVERRVAHAVRASGRFGRRQVTDEPPGRQRGDAIEGARLLEQVGGAGHDLQLAPSTSSAPSRRGSCR